MRSRPPDAAAALDAADARPRPRRATPAEGRKLKLLYLINSFDKGGAESGLVHLVRSRAFGDWQVMIRGLVAGSGEALRSLHALGADAAPLVDSPQMRLGDLAPAFVRLQALLRAERPDVLLLSLPQANILGRLAARLHRPPVVVSFEHNTHLAKPIYEQLFRLTSGRVDMLVADAPSTGAIAAHRLYRKPPEVETVLPLISFDRTALPSAKASGRYRIVNAARFTRVKNQAAIIQALATVVGGGLDAELVLFGDGPEMAKCQALAAELAVGDRVDFRGFQRDWTRGLQADLFVIASLHEGLCITALEAMDAGVPVLAPMIGGIVDYGDPEVMWVLPEVTAQAVSRAILAAAATPEQSDELRKAAFARVCARYGAAGSQQQFTAFREQVAGLLAGRS